MIEVGSDFRYLEGKILKPRARRPRMTFRAEWPAEAKGGRGSVRLYRVTGCTRTRYKLRKAGTFRARFGAKRVAIPVRRARSGYFIARFAFGGTHFLRPMPFTGQIRLGVQRRKLMGLSTSEFSAACSARATAATVVDSGTIVVGRGAGGARLDMTRAQVVAKLGKPESANQNGVLSYQPDGADAIFDVYRHLAAPKHVRMFILAGFKGSSWRLKDGNAIFAKRAIVRLYRALRQARASRDRRDGLAAVRDQEPLPWPAGRDAVPGRPLRPQTGARARCLHPLHRPRSLTGDQSTRSLKPSCDAVKPSRS